MEKRGAALRPVKRSTKSMAPSCVLFSVQKPCCLCFLQTEAGHCPLLRELIKDCEELSSRNDDFNCRSYESFSSRCSRGFCVSSLSKPRQLQSCMLEFFMLI